MVVHVGRHSRIVTSFLASTDAFKKHLWVGPPLNLKMPSPPATHVYMERPQTYLKNTCEMVTMLSGTQTMGNATNRSCNHLHLFKK